MKSACRKALILLALPFALTACVQNNTEIGKDLIDKTLLYDTYTVEFPIEDIRLRRADDLSGFSDTRLAIGAIRDETFGLTTRATAFSLVPALDTLDLGTDPKFVKFAVRFAADTISVATPRTGAHLPEPVHLFPDRHAQHHPERHQPGHPARHRDRLPGHPRL